LKLTTTFSSTIILDKALVYKECLIKEAMEIRLCPRNFNKDEGFILSVMVPHD
jgi:hypothetical protein